MRRHTPQKESSRSGSRLPDGYTELSETIHFFGGAVSPDDCPHIAAMFHDGPYDSCPEFPGGSCYDDKSASHDSRFALCSQAKNESAERERKYV
jgi:hypothetical protein